MLLIPFTIYAAAKLFFRWHLVPTSFSCTWLFPCTSDIVCHWFRKAVSHHTERPPKGQLWVNKSIYLKEYVTIYYNAMTKHFAFTLIHVNLRFRFQNLLQVYRLFCFICSMCPTLLIFFYYSHFVNVLVPCFWKGYPKTHSAENTVHRDICVWIPYSNKLKF